MIHARIRPNHQRTRLWRHQTARAQQHLALVLSGPGYQIKYWPSLAFLRLGIICFVGRTLWGKHWVVGGRLVRCETSSPTFTTVAKSTANGGLKLRNSETQKIRWWGKQRHTDDGLGAHGAQCGLQTTVVSVARSLALGLKRKIFKISKREDGGFQKRKIY